MVTCLPHAWCPECERVRICVQLARGLVYRHHGCPTDGQRPNALHIKRNTVRGDR